MTSSLTSDTDPAYSNTHFDQKTSTYGYTPGSILACNSNGVFVTDFEAMRNNVGAYVIPASPCCVGADTLPDQNRDIMVTNLLQDPHHFAIVTAADNDFSDGKDQILTPDDLQQSLIPPDGELRLGTSQVYTLTPSNFLVEVEGVVARDFVNDSGTLDNAGGYRLKVEQIGPDIKSTYTVNMDDPKRQYLEIINNTSNPIQTGLRNTAVKNPTKYLLSALTQRFDKPHSSILGTTLLPGESVVVPIPKQRFTVVALRPVGNQFSRRNLNRAGCIKYEGRPYIQSAALNLQIGCAAVLTKAKDGQPVLVSCPIPKSILVDSSMVATAGEYN